MSIVEEKGRQNSDYSRFDTYDSDVLEAILEADFDAPMAEQMDPEQAFYIARLLAEREAVETKDPHVALAEFYKYYYPMVERGEVLYDLYDLDDLELDGWEIDKSAEKEPQNRIQEEITKDTRNENQKEKEPDKNAGKSVCRLPRFSKMRHKFAGVAVLIVIFLFFGTVGAHAFGFDPFGFMGMWNNDQFWLGQAPVTKELSDELAKYGYTANVVPKWLPAGYKFDEIESSERDNFININADFYKEDVGSVSKIRISYRFYVNDDEIPLYEKDNMNIEEYVVYGVKHYIMDNLDIITIVWRNGDIEGSIKGKISVDEAKKIIDSIYEE